MKPSALSSSSSSSTINNKRKSYLKHNIREHICSSTRCVSNIILHHENQSLVPAPICETHPLQRRFLITYKNPAYVKNITTCNTTTNLKGNGRQTASAFGVLMLANSTITTVSEDIGRCSSPSKYNNLSKPPPPSLPSNSSVVNVNQLLNVRRGSAAAADVTNTHPHNSPTADINFATPVTDAETEKHDYISSRHFDNPENNLCGGCKSYSNDVNTRNTRIYNNNNVSKNAYVSYYKNISAPVSEDKTFGDKNCSTATVRCCSSSVLRYINDNLIQVANKQNSLNYECANYYRCKIPVSSSFRPLDIAKIFNYLYSNNKNNYRTGQKMSQPQFKLFTSVSRPLMIRQQF